MTYFLLQTSAMFLVAYFVGCWFGCLAKTLFAEGPVEAEEIPVRIATGGPSTRDPLPASRPLPPAPVIARAPVPVQQKPAAVSQPAPSVQPAAPAPVSRTVVLPPAPSQQRPAGSGVSAEVTAAAAAAAAATAAIATRAAATPAMPPATATAAAAADDLKRIKGIGPEIERKLNAAGITRYSQIASWSTSDVAKVNLGLAQDGRVQHENWIEQAQILARGNDTAFSRRVDRREVNSGMVDTWTPTAPGDVVRDATASAPAGAPVAQTPPPASKPIVPAPPVAAATYTVNPSPASGAIGAASAAAAAAVAAAGAIGSARSSSAAAPATPPPLQTAKPAEPAAVKAAAPAQVPVTPVATNPVGAAPVSQPISMRPAPGPGNLRRFVRLAAPEGKPDDLSLIGGVGDKIAADLNRYGIYHYWQLAAMGPDDIDYMESRLGHKGHMRREEWPEQARELMAGKPPRAKSDLERATHEHHPGIAHSHKPVTPQGAGPVADSRLPVTAGQGQPQGAPAQRTAVPLTVPAAPGPVASRDPAAGPQQPVSHTHTHSHAHTPGHHTATHHAAPAASPGTVTAGAAAAAAAAAAVTSSMPPADAAALPPAAPAPTPAAVVRPASDPGVVQAAATPVAAPAAADPSASNWTPRSRPGNQAAGGKRDDLKRIKGVGVVIEKKLEAMGITTYGQISNWTTADIDKVSNALDFKGRIEREGWVEQARILDGGGQTDFSRRMDRGDMPGGRA